MATATRDQPRRLQGAIAVRTLHPKQAAFVNSPAKRKIARAGRRGGKTVAVATLTVKKFGEGRRILYLVPTAEQLDAWWYEVTLALRPLIEAKVVKKNETEHSIEVPGTKQRIRGKTAWNADTARGDTADLLIYDEWQLMDEDAWDRVGAPMLLDNDGDAVFIYTPPSLRSKGASKARDPRHAAKMFKEHENDPSGRWATFHWTSHDNPYLSQTALQELITAPDMTQDACRKEILAEDDDLEASRLVYGAFKESQFIKLFTIPKDWPLFSWHDFGQANPAALFVAQNPGPGVFNAQIAPGDYVIWKEYLPGAGKSTAWHVSSFEDIVQGRKVVWSVGGNPNTEDEIRQGYTAHGWHIRAPRWSKPKEQIARTIAHMEKDKIWAFNNLFHFREELANCLWATDDEGYKLDKIENEPRFHLAACLRYGGSEFPAEIPGRERQKIKGRVW